MKMVVNRMGKIIIAAGFCLCFTVFVDALQNQDCDCGGPINYYKELGCTPVFKNTGDCCPSRYDCSVLNNLTNEQCVINGHVYKLHESLRPEDANTCDWCSCEKFDSQEIAAFTCATPSCAMPYMPDSSCRYQMTDNCCGGRVICPKEDGSFTTCVVDGKTYTDGELFIPAAEPEKRCRCAEGYTGENIEPYCESPKHTWCANTIWAQGKIRNCVPVYTMSQSLKYDCNDFNFRCPSNDDTVIEHANQDASEPEDPDMMCKFGNLKMRVGEKLNQSSNVTCVCDVPPILTCRQEGL